MWLFRQLLLNISLLHSSHSRHLPQYSSYNRQEFCSSYIMLTLFSIGTRDRMLSDSTPTCRPNLTSVGWSRSWLFSQGRRTHTKLLAEGMTLHVWTLVTFWVNICFDSKYFWPQIFEAKMFFLPNIYLDANSFWTQHFFGQNYFWPKSFCTQKFFWPNIFWEPKFFGYQKYFGPKFYLDLKSFWT